MVDHPAARALTGYLLVRGGVHQVAYARALELITGADMTKMFPAPRIPTEKIPECKPHLEAELAPARSTASRPDDYKEIVAVFKGPHPETGEELVVADEAPEGFPRARGRRRRPTSSRPTTRPTTSPRSRRSCARTPVSHEGADVPRHRGRPRRRRPRPARSRSPTTRSSGSRRRACAAPTCTSTRCSAPFIDEGDILGHEPMGIVEEVGAGGHRPRGRRPRRGPVQHRVRALLDVRRGPALAVRDDPGPRARHGRGAVRLHQALRPGAGRPGASSCASRHAHYAPIKVPDGPPDDRFLFLSDVLPTAWQAVEYAERPGRRHGASCSASARSATWPRASPSTTGRAGHRRRPRPGAPRARPRARRRDARPRRARRRPRRRVRELTGGRGPDAVIDAVGMEAHGSPVGELAQKIAGLLPDAVAAPLMQKAGIDRLAALHLGDRHRPPRRDDLAHRRLRRRRRPAADAAAVRQADPAADGAGQRASAGSTTSCRCSTDDDPLGVDAFATHHLPLDEAPDAYEMFQKKRDGAVKVVFKP